MGKISQGEGNNDSLIFYRSFAKSIRRLPEEEQLKALWAVIDYGLDGTEPEEDGLYLVVYEMAKPQIDANIKRKANGGKGGRKKITNGFSENKPLVTPEENHRLCESETNGYESEKPNVNVNVNENVNAKEKEKQIMCDAAALFERLWKLYPSKKGKGQVSGTQKKRLLAIGEPALVKAIERYSTELQQDAGWRKPQNGSTFFNSGYVDYLDENYSPGPKTPADRGKNRFHNYERDSTDYDDLVWKMIRDRDEGDKE